MLSISENRVYHISELLNRGLGRSASFFAKNCCQKNPEFGRKWWEVG